MITVSPLTRRCGPSRTKVLDYESIRLQKPTLRTSSNYRADGKKDLARLEQICVCRNRGLGLGDVRAILDRLESDASGILKRRMVELNAKMQTLRGHRKAILKLLQNKSSFGRKKVMTKEKWVPIMKASGFSEAAMRKWHTEFERSAPEELRDFLTFLHIPQDEIRSIREWSKKEQSR
jgi:DNA-binding transcriptional MerR regulator